jgi:hypothetical protein
MPEYDDQHVAVSLPHEQTDDGSLEENANIKEEEPETPSTHEKKNFSSPIEVNRIKMISDGVIGVAMTLLVVELKGNFFSKKILKFVSTC